LLGSDGVLELEQENLPHASRHCDSPVVKIKFPLQLSIAWKDYGAAVVQGKCHEKLAMADGANAGTESRDAAPAAIAMTRDASLQQRAQSMKNPGLRSTVIQFPGAVCAIAISTAFELTCQFVVLTPPRSS